jgi:hypothetical protein
MINNKPIKTSDIILMTNKNSFSNFKTDEFFLEDGFIEDDILKIKVSYSGGCKNHQFSLVTKKDFQNMKNIHEINLQLFHNSNKDNCKKIVTEELFFNLLPLKTKLQKENIDQKDINLVLIINNITINYN